MRNRTQYYRGPDEDDLLDELLPEPAGPALPPQRDAALSAMLQQDKANLAAQEAAPYQAALDSAQPLAPVDDSDPLDELWRDTEERYLREAAQPTKGEVGQFFADNSIGLLGTMLDLGLNKGRNIPRIMTESAQHQQRSIAGRQDDRNQAAQLATSARRARDEAAQSKVNNQFRTKQQERWARLDEQSDRDYALRVEQQKRLAEKHDLDTNPNNPIVQDLKDSLYRDGGVPRGSLDGANLVTLRQNPAYKALIDEYFRRRGISIGAQEAFAEGQAGVQGKVAGETATLPQQIANETEKQTAKIRNEATVSREEAEKAGAEKVLPGTHITNPKAYAQNAADPTTYRAMQDTADGLKTMRDAVDQMIRIRERSGIELYGPDKTAYELAQVAVNTGLTKLGSTGTLSDGERRYYESMLPGISLQAKDFLRVFEGGEDPILAELKGARDQIDRTSSAKTSIYGFAMGDAPQESGQPSPAAPKSTGAPRPQPKAAPRTAPKPKAGKSRAIRNQDGSFTVDGERYSADEVQLLKQAGVLE